MKKVLFSAYSLGLGGIETALVALLKELAKEYDITLVLEKKEGLFLKELDSNIKIIEYTPSKCKLLLFRKAINLMKKIKFAIKNYHKFQFSCSFATYSKMASFTARISSKNNCLFVHNNYLITYENNMHEAKKFFESIHHLAFKRIAFVSCDARNAYQQIFKGNTKRLIVCNNVIDDEKIFHQAKVKVDLEKKKGETWFLNVGRHDEHQKRLSRLIEASVRLKNEKIPFKVIMLGEGLDTSFYQELIKKNHLEDVVWLLGAKKNPYPYFAICDAVILTSDYEGYPVVFVESLVLNKVVLTTDVSDARKDIENSYGVVMEKNVDSITQAMKDFCLHGYAKKKKFDAKKFNQEIIKQWSKMINYDK